MAGIYIETFGCQMNEADSQYLADRATAAGYAIVDRPEEARVVVLNTCTVRDNAEQRAYGRLGHFKALKAADPALKLVVCGCLAEQDKDRMQAALPHVDAVFGTSELVRMGDAIAGWRDGFGDDEASVDRVLLEPFGGRADCVSDAYSHLRAFTTVQRGCSYYCTYCIVPRVRGRFDHRPMAEILADVRAALARGAREIMLVGQTVNAYREPATGADFADLLEATAALEGLERLSFVTSHPKDCTEKLARTMGALPQLNPRFHLPFQSGSNPVLRRMNRKYTIEQYRETVAMFRASCPDWALTTDIIVGFPGETEEDFQRTLEVCDELQFAQAYMFVYSPRRDTPAARWEQIEPAVGNDRLRRLSAVVDRGVRAFHERKVGTTVRALVQGPSRKDPNKLAAKTLDNVTAIVPRVDGLGDPRLPWIDVAVQKAFTWGVTGIAAGESARFADPAAAVILPPIDLVAFR
jgi:tRNA-2-methylthio-N6-dimethylallyladenosine synthase